jgi:hypothetical protein
MPWPRVRAVEGTHGGGSGLLLGGDLVEAVCCESAKAIMHHWGVTVGTVWRWRRALGVNRVNNDGTNRLVRAAAQKGADTMHYRGVSDEECDRRSREAIRRNQGRHLPHATTWTAAQLALLGTLPDAAVARRIGKTRNAVRSKRSKLRIPSCR